MNCYILSYPRSGLNNIQHRMVNGRYWTCSISGDNLNFYKKKFKSYNFDNVEKYVDYKYGKLKNKYDL